LISKDLIQLQRRRKIQIPVQLQLAKQKDPLKTPRYRAKERTEKEATSYKHNKSQGAFTTLSNNLAGPSTKRLD
jgi:hypothetical protein